jgi:hypothetical protein
MKYPPILRALALSAVLCLLSTVGAHAGSVVPIVKKATDAEATNGTPGVFPDAAQVKNQVDGAVATPVSWQGTWAAETDYSAGQGVIHEGSSYAAVGDPTAGDVPGVDADWQLIAAKGADGAPGTPGTPGDDGASAYVYIAYASADDGTGFTTTFDADLDYIAILATDTAIASPAAGDFAGLWKNIKGTPGSTGATGAGYGGTSTTSLAIETGSKSLTTQTGLAYVVGSYVRLVSAADVANYMEGTVSAYNSGTGAMTISVGATGGSGTHIDWNLSLAGKLGETQSIDTLIADVVQAGAIEGPVDGRDAAVTLSGWGEIWLPSPGHVRGTAITLNSAAQAPNDGAAIFADDVEANNWVEWSRLSVPQDIDASADPIATLHVVLSDSDTADHSYKISMVAIAPSGQSAATLGDEITLSFTADASGASGDVEIATGTLTGWGAALSGKGGQRWRIRVTRDGDDATNDASTADSILVGLSIRYPFAQ